MFKPAHPAEGDAAAPIPETWFNRYRVNVFVADGASAGAPVIIEDNPSYFNLLGRVDRNSAGGNAAPTDHMMLRAGSLHRANGGFLVLRAADIYAHGESWAGLKRSLLQGEIQLEDVAAQQMMVPTGAIEPYPVPLKVKVILMGNSAAYWAGYNDDEDFRALFKVKAEFSSEMPRTPENERQYAQCVRARAEEEKLLPFDRTGVAALVEYGSRQLEDQHKISAQFGRLADLIREASYWARRSQHAVVGAGDVERAQTEKHFRLSQYEDLKRQQVTRGVYFVQTEGEVVGQINGLSVLDLDEYEFGEPSRITARAFVGRGGITDLDRANNYTDGSHNKGIGLIESYLNAQYSVEQALTLTANVAFEQSYNSHSGDSASCALLCAMLSAVSGLPIDQHIAMTGTLDQFGVVQPIGGAQTKIEGFFDICRERGLDGKHMVVMPARNIDDLMLRGDVVEAIRDGKFRVVAIEHVDEAIELAMGKPAGQRDAEGVFTPDSVHAIVETVLKEINERLDGKHDKDKDKDKDGEKPADPKPEPPVSPPNAPDPHEPPEPGLTEG
jgi:predicted ATP-dependent protease